MVDLRIVLMVLVCLFCAPFCEAGHRRMVRASGIAPSNVGTHEGVGMSTRSYADAVQNACYWGNRTPVSIQYSYRGGRYYAVVRYQ